ncbi:hypothetical protein DWF00_27220 [Bosea caraganae]|uniref:ParA family protein n=1 Tax=Bosea caraganae TaxID=2763117 RepID=A0A370L9H8_9HYPH|nr:hypothetical protein [Bosea caraganae]RDJ22013.1 hypothetical protein DWF00_27220 [Bosea caraganae]RDJ27953.1 hypothetical protein DWE98_04935 [Bosea caraganae]
MELFAIAGSGNQIARLSISLLLALGFARRGMDPLLIRIPNNSGAAPSLPGEVRAPFATIALEPGDAGSTGAAILRRATAHGDQGPVVVDLPGGSVPSELLDDPRCHLLLPMATDKQELRQLAHDFARLARARSRPGNKSVVVVPIGWPAVLKQADYQRLLKREATRASSRVSPSIQDIVGFGVSDVVLGLGPLLIDGSVSPSPKLGNAAAAIARAVLRATGSSYIESDPTWSIGGL